ncbi:MAG: hypothetical protein HKM02_08550 [Pseudomonadales bacterium]|nr:hypothetical protein [Pseudomonadales bacterium]
MAMKILAVCFLLLNEVAWAGFPTAFPPTVTGDGLYGQYYNYPTDPLGYTPPAGGSLTLSRTDPTINFNWSGTSTPGPSVQQAQFAAVWTGAVYIPHGGLWKFATQTDDGAKLWINLSGLGFSDPNNLIVSAWQLQAATLDQGQLNPYRVPAAGYYNIQMNYFQNYGYASAQLYWKDQTMPSYQIIPQTYLFSLQAPVVTSTSQPCGSLNQIEVDFSSAMDPNTATRTHNYAINGSNGINISGAIINPSNPNSVLLTTNKAMTAGVTYTVTINNVKSSSGFTIANNTVTSLTPQAGSALAPGLLGRYFNQNGQVNAFFTGNEIDRVDSLIYFPSLINTGTTWPVSGIPTTNFSVEWDGYIMAPTTDDYTFTVISDDGNQMQLAGNTIINQWVLQSSTPTSSSPIHLLKNQYYPVHLNYFQGPGQSVMEMAWTNSHGTSTVPASSLFYCAANQLANLQMTSSSNASTCTPQAVTLSAVDASGQIVTTYTGSVQLGTSSHHGTWILGTGQGILTNQGSDTGSATYSFAAADNGSVTLQLSDVHADSLQVSGTSGPTNGLSNTINFSNNAFVITLNDPALNASDKLSNVLVAGRSEPMQVQLYTRNGVSGALCSVATQYSGTYNLQAWITRGAADPGGSNPTLGTSTLPNTPPGSNNLSLTFNAGTAAFNVTTSDVGQWSLNLLDNSSGFAAALPSGSNTIQGSSSTYVIRPFGFAIDFSGDRLAHGLNDTALSYADNPNDSPYFTKAGSMFPMAVQAVLWNASQDTNNDGIPDNGSNLLGDTLAVHFNTSVNIAPVQMLPSPGNVGSLSPTSVTGFTGGQSLVNASYSDVGIINIQAQLNNYLGSSSTTPVLGIAPDVGRFVPDHLALLSSQLIPACSSGFTYMQQPMTVNWQLVAQNLANMTTVNYSGAFAKLNLNGSSAAGMTFKAANVSTPTTPLSSRLQLGSLSGNTWTAGVTNPLNTNLTLTSLATPDGTYDNFTVGLDAIDSDGIGMTGFNFSSTGTGNDAVSLGSTRERYGRLWITAANGSELLPLNLPVTVQYYATVGGGNSDFITNTLDSCTTLNLTPSSNPNFGTARLVNFQGALTSGATIPSYVNPNTATLSLGQTSINLSAPNVTGSVELTFPNAPAWLMIYPYNLPISGVSATTPGGMASFGVYPGRAPIIYWHEQFR